MIADAATTGMLQKLSEHGAWIIKGKYTDCPFTQGKLLDAGVAPEQARMILPQSAMTEWYWSGSLYAFSRICNLRCASDAQYETRIVANLLNEECAKLFPISWMELRNT